MIPDDSIAFQSDGTAWLVISDPVANSEGWRLIDRPCDTCDDDGYIDAESDWEYGHDCRECDGTGRHVFRIEVRCDNPGCNQGHEMSPEDDGTDIGRCRNYCDRGRTTLRVHVVPGMILPIKANESFDARYPPAARPGMWAVKLAVHS